LTARVIDINKVLVDRCRKGDNRAQYELYHLYARQMYNVSIRIVGHAGEAEDILQDSFVEAFKRITDFREESTFGAWLKRIVVNRSVNYLRKRKLELFENIPGADQLVYEEDSVDATELQWEVKKVHRAIMELPAGYRLVLTMYLLEGYDHAEIAQVLNITESTSKSQYNRAKARLKEQLKEKNYAG